MTFAEIRNLAELTAQTVAAHISWSDAHRDAAIYGIICTCQRLINHHCPNDFRQDTWAEVTENLYDAAKKQGSNADA